jgi:hypothetical protein
MEQQESIDVLFSGSCDICGHAKAAKTAFCRKCYYSLPADKRQALWQPVGHGFEEAYDDALAWITDQRERAAIAAAAGGGK